VALEKSGLPTFKLLPTRCFCFFFFFFFFSFFFFTFAFQGKKELRQAVLAETRAILEAGKYTTETGTTVELDTAAGAGRTVFADDHKFANAPAP
jgi:hypothetical protein